VPKRRASGQRTIDSDTVFVRCRRRRRWSCAGRCRRSGWKSRFHRKPPSPNHQRCRPSPCRAGVPVHARTGSGVLSRPRVALNVIELGPFDLCHHPPRPLGVEERVERPAGERAVPEAAARDGRLPYSMAHQAETVHAATVRKARVRRTQPARRPLRPEGFFRGGGRGRARGRV